MYLRRITVRKIRDVAKQLADSHRRQDPRTQVIKLIRGDREDEIRLIEVSPDAPTIGEAMPVRFRADRARGVDFPSSVILLSPEEWGQVKDRRIPLPPGWDLSAAEDL